MLEIMIIKKLIFDYHNMDMCRVKSELSSVLNGD